MLFINTIGCLTLSLPTPAPGAMFSVMSVQEENRVLQVELGRLEDLLAHSKADRDELAIKYSAISERVRDREEEEEDQ